MAMINCPECGENISSQASTCPRCGFPVKTTSNHKTYISKKALYIILVAFVMLPMVLMLFNIAMKPRSLDQIAKIADKNGYDYTQYSDRIIISY